MSSDASNGRPICGGARDGSPAGLQARATEGEPESSHILAQLQATGWAYMPSFQEPDDGGVRMLALAAMLGRLYRVPESPPARPVIETYPSDDAPYDQPFNHLKALGWHVDFSSRRVRPRWSLSYIRSADAEHGGRWRVADTKTVLDRVRAEHPAAYGTLRTRLPFSYSLEEEPAWYRPLTRSGFRFFGRTMRDGAKVAYGSVPASIEAAIQAVESAADELGHTLPATEGALLVVDNRRVMHDRTAQGTTSRRAVLAFVRDSRRVAPFDRCGEPVSP